MIYRANADAGHSRRAPTGTVSNANAAAGDFHGDLFLFSSEAGMITGWRGALGTTAEVGNDHSWDGAIYKGLRTGHGRRPNFLYATDFHNGKIDVFDGRSTRSDAGPAAFTDPNLPKGYAPFGIPNIGGKHLRHLRQAGRRQRGRRRRHGHGFVDVFDDERHFVGRRRVAGRPELAVGHRRRRPTSATSAATCSSATSATAGSTPTDGTRHKWHERRSRCATRRQADRRSTACGRSPSVAIRPITAHTTSSSSRLGPTTRARVRSGRSSPTTPDQPPPRVQRGRREPAPLHVRASRRPDMERPLILVGIEGSVVRA